MRRVLLVPPVMLSGRGFRWAEERCPQGRGAGRGEPVHEAAPRARRHEGLDEAVEAGSVHGGLQRG
jgi:hypothetical protein